MEYGYLYFVALLLIGGGAAFAFGRLAAQKGYVAAKARRYPLLLMLAAIAAAVLLLIVSVLIGSTMPHWQGALQTVYFVGNWFVIALNLLILNLAYKNMKAAPDARGRAQED